MTVPGSTFTVIILIVEIIIIVVIAVFDWRGCVAAVNVVLWGVGAVLTAVGVTAAVYVGVRMSGRIYGVYIC